MNQFQKSYSLEKLSVVDLILVVCEIVTLRDVTLSFFGPVELTTKKKP